MPGPPSATPRSEHDVATASVPAAPAVSGRDAHPILDLVGRRAAIGIVTLFAVSAVVFLATQVLPGNAAFAVLGRGANPARLRATELQLHLNRGMFDQYWIWLSGLFTGKLGTSLANGEPVWALVEPRLINSAVLVLVTGVIGSLLGVVLGAIAALRKDSWFDHVTSVLALAVTSLPEFVVAIGLIIVLSTVVWHVLPAVSLLPPGTYAWSQPEAADPAGRDAGTRDRPVHLPDDARRHDRGPGVGLRGDGPAQGGAGMAAGAHARAAERARARPSR